MRLCTVTAHRTGRLGGTPSGGHPLSSVVRAFSGCRPLALLAILFVLAAPAPTASAEETTVASQHGDWQKVCKRPAGASEDLCALVQDVTSESNPNVGLSVHFQRTPAGERVLRVFAPLGILLPPGLGLQIDEQKIGHAPFVRCHVVGCFAQVTLTDDLVARFKAGQTAWFIVFQTQEAGIGIPISLSGFSEALASLETR
ncbi:MAG: invasion protein [Rhizobiales bacterium]|nr:invasion protein [Hyphomicrobiales bacterium]